MVNRELRGGATQSPGTLESRPGAERWIARVHRLRKSPLPDLLENAHAIVVRVPEEELDAASGYLFVAYASKRVVPRRGDPPSLYIETAGFLRCCRRCCRQQWVG